MSACYKPVEPERPPFRAIAPAPAIRRCRTVIERIISGAQTGVDRAALDVALKLDVPCGGWCPKRRRAEDGTIPARYPVTETQSANYAERTELNVQDSDGTLIISGGPITGGTALTRGLARKHDRPCLVVDILENADYAAVETWLADHRIRILNVAGPRESQQPGIGKRASTWLSRLLTGSRAAMD